MKAQASFEFLAIVMVVAILGLAIFTGFYTKIFQSGATPEQQSLLSLCSEISEKINSADYYGQGFEYSVIVPAKLGLKTYTITVSSSSLECKVGGSGYVKTLTVKNISNGTASPPFNIPSGTKRIKNSAGVVVIN